jgi:thioredoxin 2
MSDCRIVCPHCQVTNQLPEDRLSDRPHCGKCREALFGAAPPELSADAFERHLVRNDIPLLIDFWAPWCGPCRAMAPAFVEASAQLEPGVRLAKVNTDEQQAIGARYGIRSIPTMILFQGGEEVARHSGAMMTRDIVAWVGGQLTPTARSR